MKKYYIAWSERHSVVVEAKDEAEAIEKAEQGIHTGEETATMESGFDIREIEI